MIKLLEHEGKAILAASGIAIPLGGLHQSLPATLESDLVVKAQILAGGRGKAGGIRFAKDRAAALSIAAELAGASLGGLRVENVYVEERLDIAQEFYLAALVDRDLGMPVLLASAHGGMEIEAMPPDLLLRQPVDPLLGLQPFMVDRLVRGLGLVGAQAEDFAGLVERLHGALVAQDAELIEINPLVWTRAGAFVAADAKIVLDEDAAFRHPSRRARPDGTAFELAARNLDVIGVEIGAPRGIAAIMNGAGLTMATLDEIVAMGGPISGLIELHGAMMNGPERIMDVIDCVVRHLDPEVVMVNVHFQFRSLETIAEGVVKAMERNPALTPERIVLRLRGEKEAQAKAILVGTGLTNIREFGPACAEAVRRAGGGAAG